MKCLNCGKEFESKGSGVTAKKFCSPSCKSQFWSKKSRKPDIKVKQCAWCGKEFGSNREDKKFCSAECRIRAKDERGREARKNTPIKSEIQEMIIELHRRGYFVTKEPIKSDEHFDISHDFKGKDNFKFAIVSDTHLGSRYQQLSFLRAFYKEFENKVDFFIHAGDLMEGNGKLYKGQIYEMFLHGADAQLDYIIRNYPESQKPTYFIGGSHDYSFVKDAGYDILRQISESREDLRYLGHAGAYLHVKNISIYIMHPDGGGAYALSYRPQKIVEQFAPEAKPHILILGHYHRTCHIPAYRNVEVFMAGCFQAQTPYLRKKNLFPVICGQIVEVGINDKGIVNITNRYYPFYVPKEEDF